MESFNRRTTPFTDDELRALDIPEFLLRDGRADASATRPSLVAPLHAPPSAPRGRVVRRRLSRRSIGLNV